jgi:predicted nucleic acid-binding protein
MKLGDVNSGSVYVDTNVLYMCLHVDPAYASEIRAFLSRVGHGEIEAFIGVPALDELYYRLLLVRIKETTGHNPLNVLRKDPVGAIAVHGKVIAKAIRGLLGLPHVHLVGVEIADAGGMLDHATRYSMLPRDALHAAIIQRLSLTAIASDDTDFDRVEGLERYWIINPPHS